MQINPYLTFPGTAQEAITFYADVLDGEVTDTMPFSEIPDGPPLAPDQAHRLAHGRVTFPGGTIMVSDAWDDATHKGFHGFTIQTSWPTVAAARAAYDKMAAGGEEVMPFAPTFWAAGFGILRDRFGVGWMFNCDAEVVAAPTGD